MTRFSHSRCFLGRVAAGGHGAGLLCSPVLVCSLGFPYEKVVQRVLYLQVLDYDRFSRNDPIGEVSIPLNKVDLTQMQTFWKDLKPCSDGSVRPHLRGMGGPDQRLGPRPSLDLGRPAGHGGGQTLGFLQWSALCLAPVDSLVL